MKTSTKRSGFMVILGSLFLLALSAYAYASPFNYSFTNGGAFEYIDPLAGNETAAEYYDYYKWDGHPDFGTEADTAFIWLWEDTIDETISLGLIFSDPKGGHKGAGFFGSGIRRIRTRFLRS